MTTSKHQAVIDMEYTLWQLGLNPEVHSTEAEELAAALKKYQQKAMRSLAKAVYNGE